ncbi:MAG: hypothetical protein H6853_03555 [Rhodospirillales bacterium]|nr:hypothetical protein [Alphaproteobacteria bacterium]USO04358.1 MAG: hypothetical protein H6853_03555 [Rhodospirillales bacterium]
MCSKMYIIVSACLFVLVALAHLSRVVYGWPLQAGSVEVPLWLSWVGLVATGGLSVWGFYAWRREK